MTEKQGRDRENPRREAEMYRVEAIQAEMSSAVRVLGGGRPCQGTEQQGSASGAPARHDNRAAEVEEDQAGAGGPRRHDPRRAQPQKAVVKAAQDELKRRRKTAKADGCVMADLDYMARCADIEDPTIVPEEMRRRAEIASWFALPVNYQPDMFSDASPLEDTAFGQGVAAGLRGKDPVPPYDLPSKPGQRWMEGWHDGQRQAREDLPSAMDKRNAARDELLKKADDDDPAFPVAAE